ncbi:MULTISPECIES: DUF1840 domain-containing protein [Aliiglaciecola]|uniref:DUF1840 domain-containing protein n=1 Tax=Aliiglaciecola TaxID=1406885 RepID=UPI001C0A2902|nr:MULTISPECIES: DUF1840 domain-containing protein [Aliiglaciecola]MBU2879577.1 DUF1840 domain-containing protein [Aliiglaciecola lipolytica]MDO6710144.1 DUF1840 domain-containing protein [Aliiglaciecola sp. 2_MG-2023]MDO6751292.1 DUF1840 domain-containing protein [Aliiglaciecola sp. 1_MG-2023]
MLVTFSSQPSANITMFGDIAVQLLKMMGHSGTVPSAILAKDVPSALANLEAALGVAEQQPESEEPTDDMEKTSFVSLSHRALPLIDLLKAAIKDESNVQWTSNN